MNGRKRPGAILAGIVAASVAVLSALAVYKAVAAEKPDNGKYYIIYEVTADNVAVGAPIEVEPLILSNGERYAFVYDFCRRQYLSEHKLTRVPRSYIPTDTVEPKGISENDLAVLNRYCAYQAVTLPAAHYHIRDSEGLKLKLTDIQFETPVLKDWQLSRVYPPYLPRAGKAEIVELHGLTGPSRRSANTKQIPHAFLMSASSALLDRIEPVTQIDEASRLALLKRLDTFHQQFVFGETIPAEVVGCQLREPKPSRTGTWIPFQQFPVKEKPEIESTWIEDFDGDAVADLLVRETEVFEDEKNVSGVFRLDAFRMLWGNGNQGCMVQLHSLPRSTSHVVRVGSCWYIMLSGPLSDIGHAMYLFPLSKSNDMCRKQFSSQLYEKAD